MRREERGPWYLITALIIGASFGLFYSWVVSPVEYIDTVPSLLREDFKDQYRLLVAAAFASNRDIARAQARLNQLGETEVDQILLGQAQRALAEGLSQVEVENLEKLALSLSQGSSFQNLPTTEWMSNFPLLTATTSTPTTAETALPPTSTPTNTPGAQITSTAPPTSTQAVNTPAPTLTPLPTRTPTPTVSAPFVLKQEAALVCNPGLTEPLIMVEAYDISGNPIPGVQVIVRWPGGEDRFFTGLKPDLGMGYADFNMAPDVPYTVSLAEGGQPASGLTAMECETRARERYWGSWQLIFVHP